MPIYGGDLVVPDVSIHELVWNSLPKHGDAIAIVDAARDGKSIKYLELYDFSRRCASYLQAWGIKTGDFVSICSWKSIEFAYLSIGIVASGGVVAPCNPSYRKNEILQQFAITRPRVVFVDEEVVETMKLVKKETSFIEEIFVTGQSTEFSTLSTILKEGDADKLKHVKIDPANDVAFAPHSSGTTGLPKCILMTHKGYAAYKEIMMQLINAATVPISSISFYCDRPLYHAAGFLSVLTNAVCGIRTVTNKESRVETMLTNIEKYKCTFSICFPPMLVEMFNVPDSLIDSYDLTSLKMIGTGGAALSPHVAQRIIKRFKVLLTTGYVMTEAGSVASGMIFEGDLSNSSGKVKKGVEVKITDVATDEECATGADGEIRIRSLQMMKGYLNNPAANAAAFDSDGWFKTGDIGHFDERENLYVVDRMKEIINYRTVQVSPAELESVIIRHPKVADVGVIGIPDEASGEVPKAFVVPRDTTLSISDVHEIVNDNLVEYKHLRGGVEFVSSIPKSATGKIQRKLLKEMAGI